MVTTTVHNDEREIITGYAVWNRKGAGHDEQEAAAAEEGLTLQSVCDRRSR